MVKLGKRDINSIVRILNEAVERESAYADIIDKVLSLEWHENGYPSVAFSKKGYACPLPNTKVVPVKSLFKEEIVKVKLKDGRIVDKKKVVLVKDVEKIIYHHFNNVLKNNYLPEFDKLQLLQRQCSKFGVDMSAVYSFDHRNIRWDLYLTVFTNGGYGDFDEKDFLYKRLSGFDILKLFKYWVKEREAKGYSIPVPKFDKFQDSFSVYADYTMAFQLVEVLSLFLNEVLFENNVVYNFGLKSGVKFV